MSHGEWQSPASIYTPVLLHVCVPMYMVITFINLTGTLHTLPQFCMFLENNLCVEERGR